MPLATITELANRYGSDKGNVHGSKHKYSYLYDLIFHPYRSKKICFLEMGLAIGGPELGGPVDRTVVSPSVEMWLEYFPSAKIFGFDISDFSHQTRDRFTFVRGDSGKVEDFDKLIETAPAFDIVIDDASHASYHQLLALKKIYPRVSFDGLYIIEDLQWQSPYFEEQLPKVPTAAVFLQAFFEEGRYIENELISETEMQTIGRETASFAVFSGFDGSEPRTKLFIFRKKPFELGWSS